MIPFLSSAFVVYYLDPSKGGLILGFEAFWKSHLVLIKSL